jgi:hypothetical protein
LTAAIIIIITSLPLLLSLSLLLLLFLAPLSLAQLTTTTTTTTSFPPSSNDSAIAVAIAHRLGTAASNAGAVNGAPGREPCMPRLDKFINAAKEALFTVIKPCVTVSGVVIWKHYFNTDGDAVFNVKLDPTAYKGMLGTGTYGAAFAKKYPSGPGMHMEVVCQGPVTSPGKNGIDIGACNKYNGPQFQLPALGDHVVVTGRYLIEMPELPGGITELHPVYAINIVS